MPPVITIDAFHVVRSDLVGGKGMLESVSSQPRVFATLTSG